MGRGGALVRLAIVVAALFVAGRAFPTESPPALVFDATAESLPQADIRAAVDKELGGLAVSPEAASRRITVTVDQDRGLVVRYETPSRVVERALPMPSNRDDVPLIISLAAGNLARDQSGVVEKAAPVDAIVHKFPEDQPKTVEAPPAPRPPPVPPFRRNWLGIHVAQDVAFVGGSNVCDPKLGQMSDNYACFYDGTDDEPFLHTPFPYEDGIATGPVLATTRLLVSYEHAPSPWASFGVRVGMAFGGGPPAGQEPAVDSPGGNPNNLPAHTKATGGTPFMPVHLELRANFWFLPLDRGPVSAFLGISGGVAQVDSKTTVEERDCAETLDASWNPANGSFDDCRLGKSNMNWKALTPVTIDAWKKMGQGFVSANLGGMAKVTPDMGFVLNLNFMLMAPAAGLVLEPSLGFAVGL